MVGSLDGQGDGAPKACPKQAAAEGRINLLQSQGGRAGLPASVSGRHEVR